MWEKKSGKNENRRMHYSEDREERPPDLFRTESSICHSDIWNTQDPTT